METNKPNNPSGQVVSDIYLGLRNKALTLQLGPMKTEEVIDAAKVWGLLVESAFPKQIMTLATFADGTSSVYLSNGGAFIGWGKSAEPLETSRALLTLANQLSAYCQPAAEFPLPRLGYTRFHLKSSAGISSLEVSQPDLENDRHPMAPLFHKANRLVVQIHTLAKKSKAGAPGASAVQ
jgi:hypothetical protein